MPITRTQIETVRGQLAARLARSDWDAWTELFSEDCRFKNSAMSEPVIGRRALLALTDTWLRVDNQTEWYAIDGNRLVIAWNERQESMKQSASRYRGFSTFVFDQSGLISSYEGMFDMMEVMRSMEA